ncbi:MAG: AAA family ATPase, partial [Spirochaetota bacterium]
MVTSVRFSNFKSYQGSTLELSTLTLLVGANASGKSNALEGIRLISWLASGARLDSIGRKVQAGDTEFRGKVTDLFNDKRKPLDLEVVLSGKNEWNRFHIALAFRDGALRIYQEEITSPAQSFPLYRVERPATGLSHDIEVVYNNFARGGKKPHIVANDQLALFTQLETPARFDKNHEKAQQVI